MSVKWNSVDLQMCAKSDPPACHPGSARLTWRKHFAACFAVYCKMILRFILVFLFASTTLSAQRKVSEVCAQQKASYDSAMRVEYGDSLFENCFVFDTGSYVWADPNHMCLWNDTMIGDTVRTYDFFYSFRFPGSKIDETSSYRPATDRWGRLIPDTSGSSPEHCKLIGEKQMDEITRKHLGKPLRKCHTRIYPFDSYSPPDYSETVYLDSTHVYLEVEFERYRGSGKRGTKFTSFTKTLLVDACTGEVIGKDRERYKGVSGYF